MRFHVLSLFPSMFDSPFAESIVARARKEGLIDIEVHDIREHADGPHRSVDDYAFGGGPGMVMKPEPIFKAAEAVRSSSSFAEDSPVVLLSPKGRRLTQRVVEELSEHDELMLICGRYEGVDERVRQHLATDEISIGDFVLSGGEIAAMVVIDTVSRLLPGVVGSMESTQDDSFTTGLLQFPQYTRPAEFRGWRVPDMLLSGNHGEIARWRREESLRATLADRPDLLDSADLSAEDRVFIQRLEE